MRIWIALDFRWYLRECREEGISPHSSEAPIFISTSSPSSTDKLQGLKITDTDEVRKIGPYSEGRHFWDVVQCVEERRHG